MHPDPINNGPTAATAAGSAPQAHPCSDPIARVVRLARDLVHASVAFAITESHSPAAVPAVLLEALRGAAEPLVLEDTRARFGAEAAGEIGALIGMPLHASDGRWIGALCIAEPGPRPWSPLDIDRARDVAALLQHELARGDEARTTETLHRTGLVLAAELDLEKLLQVLTDEATELSGARFGAFFYNVNDPQGETYLLYTLSGAPREAFARFPAPRNTPLFAPTFSGERVVRLDDVTADPRYGTMAPHHGMPPGHLPVRSYLAVPVVARAGEVLGGLFFGHPEVGVFTERHERLVTDIAEQAAIAVENARLFQSAERARHDAEQAAMRNARLQTITAALSEASTPDQVARVVVDQAIGALKAAAGVLFRLTDDGAALEVMRAVGFGKAQISRFARIPLDAPLAVAQAVRTGEPVWVSSVDEFLARFPAVKGWLSPDHGSWAALPVMLDRQVVGTLSFSFDGSRTFDAHDRAFMMSLAPLCAQALERARLYEASDRARDEAESARRRLAFLANASSVLVASLDYEATLQNVARLAVPELADACSIELRDPITGGFRTVAESEAPPSAAPMGTGEREPIVLPMAARGRILGTMSFSSRSRRFSSQDVALFNELAQRAALALENARLFHETREALQRNRESLALLDTLLRSAPVGLAFVDPELRFVRVNESLAQLNGKSVEEHLGRTVMEIVPDVAQHVAPLYRRVLETGEPIRDMPVSGETSARPGETRHFNVSYYPVATPDGARLGVGIVVTDYTDRHRAEEERTQLLERERTARAEAEEANRAKDDFLATLSHELRTPLNAMLGWAQLLRTGKLTDGGRVRALETIERNAKLQAQLVEDILDVSRIIAGKLRLRVRDIDLTPIIAGALDAVRPAADAKGVTVSLALDFGAGLILGDAERLQQVVWNLLSNAVKFTPKGGRVDVRAQRRSGSVVLRVSDSGRGIAPEFLPHVFDRFRQADSTMTRQQGGLGLGLAIVRHLVELHGGTVEAASAGPGHGATFTVTLPMRAERDAALPLDTPAAPGLVERDGETPDLAGVRVLVVDDEEDARTLVRTVLEQHGADVCIASSCAEALALFEERPPTVLVSDVAMPGEDGYALIRKVRARAVDQGGDVAAVALTACASVDDSRQALLAGFQMHVPKPIETEDLVWMVAKLAGWTKA